MDWNWFFSSLAQCGAALIGIIAAFIISKLLNESEKADVSLFQLRKLINKYSNIIKRIRLLDIANYNQTLIRTSYRLVQSINNGDFDTKSTDVIETRLHQLLPSLYKFQENLSTLDSFMKEVKSAQDQNSAVFCFHESIDDAELNDEFINEMTEMDKPEFYKAIERKRNEIESYRIESETLIGDFEILKDEVNAKDHTFRQLLFMLYLLILGFYCTVLYPLSFLPISSTVIKYPSLNPANYSYNVLSIQGLMLFLLLLFISCIFVYFIVLVYRLKRKYRKIFVDIKNEYLNLRGYSEFFELKPE